MGQPHVFQQFPINSKWKQAYTAASIYFWIQHYRAFFSFIALSCIFHVLSSSWYWFTKIYWAHFFFFFWDTGCILSRISGCRSRISSYMIVYKILNYAKICFLFFSYGVSVAKSLPKRQCISLEARKQNLHVDFKDGSPYILHKKLKKNNIMLNK